MDLKLPIKISDELTEDVIESTGILDLASGDIYDVKRVDPEAQADIEFPAENEDYEFTSGSLSNGKKEVEFRIEVDAVGRKYSVTPSELLELKGRAARLFSAAPGVSSLTPPPAAPAPKGRKPAAKR